MAILVIFDFLGNFEAEKWPEYGLKPHFWIKGGHLGIFWTSLGGFEVKNGHFWIFGNSEAKNPSKMAGKMFFDPKMGF